MKPPCAASGGARFILRPFYRAQSPPSAGCRAGEQRGAHRFRRASWTQVQLGYRAAPWRGIAEWGQPTTAGRTTVKREPLPSADSTQMRPSCESTMDLTIDSPRPVPATSSGTFEARKNLSNR